MNSPDVMAVEFLSHYIELPKEELDQLDITHGLASLLESVVIETVRMMNDNEGRVLH